MYVVSFLFLSAPKHGLMGFASPANCRVVSVREREFISIPHNIIFISLKNVV